LFGGVVLVWTRERARRRLAARYQLSGPTGTLLGAARRNSANQSLDGLALRTGSGLLACLGALVLVALKFSPGRSLPIFLELLSHNVLDQLVEEALLPQAKPPLQLRDSVRTPGNVRK
jgi:hypothetical protein